MGQVPGAEAGASLTHSVVGASGVRAGTGRAQDAAKELVNGQAGRPAEGVPSPRQQFSYHLCKPGHPYKSIPSPVVLLEASAMACGHPPCLGEAGREKEEGPGRISPPSACPSLWQGSCCPLKIVS